MRLLTEIHRQATFLHECWTGHRFVGVTDLVPGAFDLHLANVVAADLRPRLQGVQVHSVKRKGRHVLITLRNGLNPYRWFVLQWTPGPTGAWHPVGEAPEGSAFVLELSEGQRWLYHDRCGWGRMWLWSHSEVVQGKAGSLSLLGPDWLDAQEEAQRALSAFNPESTRTVKAVLLDQEIAAGLDNTIACEVLFAAKIHPHTIWRWLSPAQRFDLAREAARFAVTESRSLFLVHDRTGDWCLREGCVGSISEVMDSLPLTTRSFVCHLCQPEPEGVR